MLFKKYDVIIAGAGVSGLYAAYNLDGRLKILMLSKRELTLCNSALAQGGVAAVIDKSADDFELHISDSLVAGGYENNRENLRILVERGPENIEELLKIGVDFDKNSDGSIALALEGGHSRNRIAHHRDSTGYEIVTSLIEKVRGLENVDLFENAHLLRLEKRGDDFRVEAELGGVRRYYTTKVCVLATGGIGRVYNFTTNSATATGDGIRFAYNMGAEIKKMNYIQFHPTAFADRENRECFLISEAVRGEGAYLYNRDKERFMKKYEPVRMELAPRDVVSRCVIEEGERLGSSDFYLDISHKDGEFVKSRFPMIYERVLEKGYDLTKEPIPVYPCQHYLMGGIAVGGATGRTRVEGLYAAGECAHTGVHGKNRLASNSLLEALVFSRLAAADINRQAEAGGAFFEKSVKEVEMPDFPDCNGESAPDGLRAEIRGIMQKSFFVTPDYAEAKKGLARVAEIKALLESGRFGITPRFAETKSLATVAWLILDEVVKTEGGRHDFTETARFLR
ncbi:MAG: FAD-binding protein [Oscillospiraceae bacterium]|jgi:L-aspartate oxidase|nr:FAD-binding protein [Oscillospiraceae bacterium]